MNVREKAWGFIPPKKPKGCRKAPEPVQLSLAHARTQGRGGPRPGSGRKKGPRPNVRHRARDRHAWYQPVHVTLRRAKGLPSLRSERVFRVVRGGIRATRHDGFRIVQFSVQADHVHMIVEADDGTSLTNGMRSLMVRVARRVNRDIFRRRGGRVWGDRYHRHDLKNPREVRNSLVYVLNNYMKHGEWQVGRVDPCSSGPYFTGWVQKLDPPPEPTAVALPTTWLLREGWTRAGAGAIGFGEVPRAARA